MQAEIKQKHMDTTAVYRGKSDITRDCVTGKLRFLRMANEPIPDDCAVIPVFDEEDEPLENNALFKDWDAFSAVALIFIGTASPQALREKAMAYQLPLLLLQTLPAAHPGFPSCSDASRRNFRYRRFYRPAEASRSDQNCPRYIPFWRKRRIFP